MRLLITGCRGQLGVDLQHTLNTHSLVPCSHEELDITDADQVETVLSAHRPDMVINTAAYHKVDECESYPEKTFAVNALGPRNLALSCRGLGITLVHVSTNFVFDGTADNPYDEQDLPGPVNVYGTAKLAGEHLVRALCPRHFLIRTAGLYGLSQQQSGGGKGYNFVDLMLKLGRERGRVSVVCDQILAPTYTADLAETLARLIETDAYGTWHITNNGACSYYDFTRTIYRIAGIDAVVEPVSTAAFGAKARRPLYGVLDNKRIRTLGIKPLRTWEEGLKEYLHKRWACA
ncbi:MAG: dTDP-4-dehydrorhamnose reductase [candidate division Zixibacteria bacterium]|nr:dTDP-4-dehydrorhamnose reductase [candidate division Zixibacteria bacterium]